MTTISELLHQKADAIRAKDPKAMTAGYAPGAVIYNLAPPLRQLDDARDPQPAEQWLATFESQMNLEIRDLEITEEGDLAYATAIEGLSATPKGSTESFTLWYRVTYALRRIDGRWQITHEHQSVPFEMDGSFAASIHLEP
ncbi:nuclear transport factor 2 family protein [Actinoplanes sp. NPDC051633]|uniref:nuclear transport factor 2 family protein n=1 Tax=Actinoplanes sp. NPDC051633 TaxID=3155670 RepID=UPI00343F1E8E